MVGCLWLGVHCMCVYQLLLSVAPTTVSWSDLDETLTSLDSELLELVEQAEYASSTLPRSRNGSRSQSFRHTPAFSRPQSLSGLCWKRVAFTL